MQLPNFAENLMMLPPMILSLTVHEWAHAWSARRLGDDTAERAGRLTLNPIDHYDLLGTIVLPLLGVPFGWAKPVPVNPARFNRKWSMSAGMAITAAAGPLSNLVLAVVCAVLWVVLHRTGHLIEAIDVLLKNGLVLNVSLMLFNFIPLPPLDGSRIADHFMPRGLRDSWESVRQFGPVVLFVLIAAGGVLLSGPVMTVSNALFHWVQVVAYRVV